MNWKAVSVFLVLAGGLLWMFWPEVKPVEDTEVSEGIQRSRKVSKDRLNRETITWRHRKEDLDFFKKHGVPVLTPEQLEQYLADQKYSAEAFVAAFYVSQEAQFLKDGLERHPESGFLLFTLLSIYVDDSGWSSEELLNWCQRFLKVEPDNFFAHVLMADQLMVEESTGEAMSHLGEAFLQTTMRDYNSEKQAAIRQMYESLGSTPEQASVAILGPKLRFASRVNFRVVSVGKKLRRKFHEMDPKDADNARLAIHSLGEALLNFDQPRTLMSEVFGLRLKKYVWNSLPDEAPSFEEGMTVAQAEQARESRLDEIGRMAESEFDVHAASTEVLHEYLNRVWQNGEISAIQWLHAQVPLKKNPGDRE